MKLSAVDLLVLHVLQQCLEDDAPDDVSDEDVFRIVMCELLALAEPTRDERVRPN